MLTVVVIIVKYLHSYIYISSNELISYIYEFGPGSLVISSYATAICELGIAIIVSLSSKSVSCSVSQAVMSSWQPPMHDGANVPG